MKKIIPTVLAVLTVISLMVVGLFHGIVLDDLQKETLLILVIICGSSALYCFVIGEITHNNSQMDKLWSILPMVYMWIIAIKGGMSARLTVMATLVTIWGIRLTLNFARKGAYSIKFWTGKEDYRWSILRRNPLLKSRITWAIFDLFFISIIQNALVLGICLPGVALMSSAEPFSAMDYVATVLMLFFIIYETIADFQQYLFQTKKYQLLKAAKELKNLPSPYNLGFNTHGLFAISRHPNYFAEQAIWVCFYLFTIGAKVTFYGVFNWSIVGCLFLVILFIGSSTMGESISASKYPEYASYQKRIAKYFPLPWKK